MENKELMAEETNPRNFDISSFSRAKEKMIATSEKAYHDRWGNYKTARLREYTKAEIDTIITSGSLSEQQKLSQTYFYKDGYYKQIIIHYATLLQYQGVLIPNPSLGKKLSTSHIQKRYYAAMDYIENMELKSLQTALAQKVLINGSYYGIIAEINKDGFQLIDIPQGYAQTRYKDMNGTDIVEFDLSYFDSILDKETKKLTLNAYPKFISKAYTEFSKGKRKSKWLFVPAEYGVYFSLFGERPYFINVIPSTIDYEEAVLSQKTREEEEIHKIIVQKVPHLSDGRLLFEPEEAEEMHDGSVQMMKGNKNVSILTTYCDVDAISSNLSTDQSDSTLKRMEQNIYAQAGASGQLFAATGSSSLKASTDTDTALMMVLADKFSKFISRIVNTQFGNGNVTFKYQILPLTYHNAKDYVDMNHKLLQSGYSMILPALATGLSQRDLINIKDLENDVLKLSDKLLPPRSSYTQSASEASDDNTTDREAGKSQINIDSESGRPSLTQEDKAEKTLQNEESLDKTGGS